MVGFGVCSLNHLSYHESPGAATRCCSASTLGNHLSSKVCLSGVCHSTVSTVAKISSYGTSSSSRPMKGPLEGDLGPQSFFSVANAGVSPHQTCPSLNLEQFSCLWHWPHRAFCWWHIWLPPSPLSGRIPDSGLRLCTGALPTLEQETKSDSINLAMENVGQRDGKMGEIWGTEAGEEEEVVCRKVDWRLSSTWSHTSDLSICAEKGIRG